MTTQGEQPVELGKVSQGRCHCIESWSYATGQGREQVRGCSLIQVKGPGESEVQGFERSSVQKNAKYLSTARTPGMCREWSEALSWWVTLHPRADGRHQGILGEGETWSELHFRKVTLVRQSMKDKWYWSYISVLSLYGEAVNVTESQVNSIF